MARITASDRVAFALEDFDLSTLFEGERYETSSTVFRVFYDDGTVDEIGGRNFSFNAQGVPTGGTVTGYTQFDGAGPLARLQGIEVSVNEVLAAAQTGSTSDDLALFIRELSGGDRFDGGSRADYFESYGGGDKLYGFGGNDTLSGLDGNDQLYGGEGKDQLLGGAGGDKIWGGLGADRLFGGGGKDTFYFDTALGGANVDRIDDFNVKDDRISLDSDIFKGVGDKGKLAEKAFWVGNKAHDGSDRIVYNEDNGKLFYDPDGDGSKKAIQFATLDAGLDLKAGDFLVA